MNKGIDEIPCEYCHVHGDRDAKAVSVQQLHAAFHRQHQQHDGSEIERQFMDDHGTKGEAQSIRNKSKNSKPRYRSVASEKIASSSCSRLASACIVNLSGTRDAAANFCSRSGFAMQSRSAAAMREAVGPSRIIPLRPLSTTFPQSGDEITGRPYACASSCVIANPSESVGRMNTSAFL